ncbi:two-partner secretion domain-containing protein, partial [Propionispora vibrioides]
MSCTTSFTADKLLPLWLKKKIAYVTIFALVSQPLIVGAEAVADSQAAEQNRPKVETTQNGTPIVQITAPSAAGVSRNIYSQFNVDPQGLILNNSQTLTQTQLAGYITGNPNLANGTAKIILSEVSGHDPSTLRGYTEVAGSRAEVVIANPNGITGNGFGFINANRAVLTTGTPVFGGNGSLEAFRVNQGQITVEGNGMDAQQTDRADLISRAVQVNAGIWGKEVNVVAGANQVEHDSLQATALAVDNNRPQVAIDVSSLGGMYANKIRLVGTEQGVGVNSQGIISAAGDVTIDSAGKVSLSQASAGGNIAITSGDQIINQNSLYAQGNTTVNAQGEFFNNGILVSGQQTSIAAQNVFSTGTLSAGISDAGKVGNSGDLVVTAAGTIVTRGRNIAAGDLSLQGTDLDLSDSQTTVGGNTTLTAIQGDIINTGGSLQTGNILTASAQGNIHNDQADTGIQAEISAGQLKLTAANLTNQNSRITQTGTHDSIITASDTLDNTGGQIGTNGTNSILQAANIVNRQGQIQHAGTGTLALQATGDVTNIGGKISTNGQVAVNANTLDNTQGTLTAQKQVNITVQNDLINQQGSLVAGDVLNITAQGNVINQQGDMEANKGLSVTAQVINNQNGKLVNLDDSDLKITAGQDIQNQSGVLGGNGKVTFTTQTLENQGGKITAKQDLSIAASQGVDSNVTGSQVDNSGAIVSGGDLTLQSSGNILLFGNTSAQGNLTVTTDGDVNSYGTVYGQEDTTISSTQGTLTNTGTIVAGKNTVLGAQNLRSLGIIGAGVQTDGSVGTNGNLRMNATQHLSTSGQNMAASSLTVTAGEIDLSGSTTYANNDVSLTSTAGDIINKGGSLQAQGKLTLTAKNAIDNSKATDGTASTMQADGIVIKAQSISNTGSTMIQTGTGDTQIVAADEIDNTGGTIATNGNNLNLTADIINNSQGTVAHAGAGTLNIRAISGVTNTYGGTIQANNNANLAIGDLDNTLGRITALNKMSITGQNIINDQGVIAAGGNLDIGLQDSLINRKGTVEAENALTLNAGTVTNQEGSMTSLDDSGMTVNAQAIDNTSGTMGGNGEVNVTAQTLTNNTGKILSQGNLTANISQSIDNTGGTITAQQNVTLGGMGTAITNASQGNIAAGNILLAKASTLNNLDGTMTANQDVNLTAGAINNAGNLTAGQDLNLTVNGDFTSTSGNTMKANRDIHLSANKVNNAGSLSAVRGLTVDAANVTNNAGGNLQGGEELAVTVTGNMANAGNMEANTVDISAQAVDNTGSVFGNNLTVTADTISNHDAAAVIATTQNTNLFAKTSLENKDDANIYSMGNIHIAGSKNQDANGEYIDKTGSVLNQSATIQADGSIGIYADTLTNKKREFETGEQVVSTNQYATGSYWDMRNSTWIQGSVLEVRAMGTFVLSPNSGGYVIDGEKYWYPISGLSLNRDNAGIKLSQNNRDSVWLLGETISETNIVKDSPSGRIVAGKDIRLNAGQVNNDLSNISAAGSLTVSADTVNNTTTARVRSTTEYLYNVHLHREWAFTGNNGSPQPWNYSTYRPQTVTTDESLPGYSSVFGGGQQVTIEAQTINNLEVAPSTVTSGNVKSISSSGQTQGAAVATGSSNNGGNIALTGTVQNLLPPAKDLPSVAPQQTINDDQIVLPTNAMYKIVQEPSAHYLVETNPRFANYKDFISSDYMLQQLGLDPDKAMKRLGDGFYEQKLVSEQINELTGRAMLSNTSSTEEQYKTLLNNGATYASQFNLQVGVALTNEQMANLTSDMVWLVEKEVDGQKVLVPTVYLAQVRTDDLKADGALIAADNIVIKTPGDLTNMGVIKATQKVDIAADNLSNLTGLITGGQTDVTAKHTIALTGGTISAIGDVNLNAGQNITVNTVEQQSRIAVGSYLKEQTTHAGSSIQAGNNVNLTAQSDISLQGANIESGKDLTLTTTNGNIDISEVKDRTTEDHRERISNGWKRVRTDDETVIGTTLNGGNQVTVHAGALEEGAPSTAGNINIEGSYIASDNGKVNLLADKDITIKEATEKHESLVEKHQVKSGFLSKKTTDTRDYSLINQAVGSTISGDAVDIHANNDITVKGSSVVGSNAVNLTAGKDINLTSAAETGTFEHYKMTKKSGVFGGGGFGITIGKQSEKLDVNEKTLDQVGSTIGSVNESVSINAGKQVTSDGTTLVAQKDITITGNNVSINNSVDTYDSNTKYEFKQSGISVSLGGGVVNTLNDTASHVERSSQVSDDRLKTLYDYKAAKDIKKLSDQ